MIGIKKINKKSLAASPSTRRRGYSRKAKINRQLLMLMTILTQAFFTLMRGHLMSLMLLSVWHNCDNYKC